jgi:hypothetical protein
MKIPALIPNEQGVSVWSEVEIPMMRKGPRSMISARQNATDFQYNTITAEGDRFGKMPFAETPKVVTTVHEPRILVITSGRRELQVGWDPKKMQFTGESRVFGPGQIFYVWGVGGHRPSGVANTIPLSFADTGKWNGKGKPVGVFR